MKKTLSLCACLLLAGTMLFTSTLITLALAESDTSLARDLAVSDAWVRVPIAGQKNSAAFMTLTNNSNRDIALVAVETDLAARAELHSHRMSEGMMRMRHEEKVVITAGSTLTLEPGGMHIMLFDLARTIQTGDTAELQLIAVDGRQLAFSAAVKSVFDETHHHH